MWRSDFDSVLSRVPKVEPNHAVAIFSVNFGGYDTVKSANSSAGYDFIMFTDSRQALPKPWRKVYVDSKGTDPFLLSKLIKALSHFFLSKHDATLYIDASFVFLRPVDKLLVLIGSSDFSLFRHPSRICIYEEARQCLVQNKGESSQIIRQVEHYRREGVPANLGLFAGGVIYRNHKASKVCEINEGWAVELCRWSLRDQLSLAVVLRRYEGAVDLIPGNVFWNEYLVPTPHSRSSALSKFKWHLKAMLVTGIRYPAVVRAITCG